MQSGFIVGHSLLTAKGVPCAGEGDIKTNIAMKICDILGTGGSFCEIVAMDYIHSTMLLGHDGPFHISISDGKPMLRGLGVYHGKKGFVISVEANVISGPVTMLGLTQLRNGNLRLIVSEGIAKKMIFSPSATRRRMTISVWNWMRIWMNGLRRHQRITVQ